LKCPFVGDSPVGFDDALFGRDPDTKRIETSIHFSPLTLLFGPSGAGKSSVLQAGVFRQLDNAQRVVVYFHDWKDRQFLAKLKNQCVQASKATGDLAADLDTLVADLSRETRRTFVLLLDQFDDFLALHADTAEGDDFAEQCARIASRRDIPVRLLLSLREDHLPELADFDPGIPHLFSNRLRLLRLDLSGAEQAVSRTVEDFNKKEGVEIVVEPDLLHKVLVAAQVRDRKNEYQPFLLQLIMRRVWETDLVEADPGREHVLRGDTFEQLGGLKGVLRRHLADVVESQPGALQEPFVRLFRALVPDVGMSRIVPTLDLLNRIGFPTNEATPLLEHLVARRVLQHYADPDCYALFHEDLAEVVREWLKSLQQEEPSRQGTARLEELQEKLDSACIQLRASEMRELIAWSLAYIEDDVNLAILLAAQAVLKSSEDTTWDPCLALQRALCANERAVNRAGAGRNDAERALVETHADAIIVTDNLTKRQWALPGDSKAVACLNPDGKHVAIGDASGGIAIWEFTKTTAKLFGRIALRSDQRVTGLEFSQDGKHLASSLSNGVVSFFDWEKNRRLGTVRASPESLRVMRLSKDELLMLARDSLDRNLTDDESLRFLRTVHPSDPFEHLRRDRVFVVENIRSTDLALSLEETDE